jgi:purine-binding chemotaxis protein CheW
MEKQFVSFLIAQKKYCLDIMDVKEVVKESNITVMPDSPFFVEGIMNLRGIVVPVISIKKKLGIKDNIEDTLPPNISDSQSKKKIANKLIIITLDNILIGLLVDSLDRVFSIDTVNIQASEKFTEEGEEGIDKSLVNGVARLDNELFLILDIRKLLDYEEKSFIKKEIVE